LGHTNFPSARYGLKWAESILASLTAMIPKLHEYCNILTKDLKSEETRIEVVKSDFYLGKKFEAIVRRPT
jgi:hypothetical protein